MQDRVPRPATYDDVLAAPPHVVAEILRGKLVTHPRPALRHSAAATRLGSILTPPFDFGDDGPGGWLFIDEPELHLASDVVVPDLAAWRRERLPEVPDAPWLELAPDWVCEVLSPSTERYDRGDKREIYAEAGVGHLWFLDVRVRLLEVFALEAGRWMLDGVWRDEEEVAAAPFAALGFSLGRLWSGPSGTAA